MKVIALVLVAVSLFLAGDPKVFGQPSPATKSRIEAGSGPLQTERTALVHRIGEASKLGARNSTLQFASYIPHRWAGTWI